MQDLETRIANFQKMAEADPENELAHFSLGKLFGEAGRHAEAVESLRRALALKDDHSLAHQHLGTSLLALGEKAEAIEAWTRGVGVAHARGERMPRDKMIELLEAEGAPVPELDDTAPAEPEVAEGSFRCERCQQVGVALDEPPFSTELGRKIHATICTRCWREWMGMSVKVINELRLNLMAPKDSEVYDGHMKEFLGLGD